MSGTIKLYTLGRNMSQFQLINQAYDGAGNITDSGTPGSFLGRWDEGDDTHEEETEDIRPTDQFAANAVSVGADDTYTITEILTQQSSSNVIYNFWASSIPGSRYVRLTITFGGQTDAFFGIAVSRSRGPYRRGKNVDKLVVKRASNGLTNPVFTP